MMLIYVVIGGVAFLCLVQVVDQLMYYRKHGTWRPSVSSEDNNYD